jgi:rare lipoprotein A (peptidoglycan hydrolase)
VARTDWTPIAVALLVATPLAAGCGGSGSPQRVPALRAVAPLVRTSSRGALTQTSAPNAATQPASTTADPSSPRAIPPAHPVPAAFRPAPGALSDAEVRSELEHLSALQRRERERELSPAAANLQTLLPWALEHRSGVSVASVFTDYGLGLACGGVLGRHELGVAHKTAPCGTLITFTYNGRSLTVPVIDRGPYIAGREWDLTGATAEALGFPGLGQIEWHVAA